MSIGHNRDIAWGFTNVMLDGADFFVEKLRPETGEVMSRGEWVKLETRDEMIKVKGGADVRLKVTRTPHGPLVTDLLPGEKRALAYQWNYAAPRAQRGRRVLRPRARPELGRVPRRGAPLRRPRAERRLRRSRRATSACRPRGPSPGSGAPGTAAVPRGRLDGTEDWDGFVPFEDLPSSFDPPEGWLASANNPTVPRLPYYISSQWEPVDRYTRIRELLEAREKLSVDDMKRSRATPCSCPRAR